MNFATSAKSNVTTPGFTLGLGIEFRPEAFTLAGHPMSIFAQYQHTWYSSASFATPSSSPLFNYGFRRQDDTIRLGVKLWFNSPNRPIVAKY